MTLLVGEIGPCFWTYVEGQAADDAWNDGMRAMERFVSSHEHSVVLTLTYKASPPTPRQRQLATNTMKRIAHQGMLGHAVVTESRLIYGTLIAIGWFVHKPFEERFFTSLAAATRWLKTLRPDLQLDEVHRNIAARLPPHVPWGI